MENGRNKIDIDRELDRVNNELIKVQAELIEELKEEIGRLEAIIQIQKEMKEIQDVHIMKISKTMPELKFGWTRE